MNCKYYHDNGAYCDKHSHGAITLSCTEDRNCPDIIKRTNTKADRIRNMSNEELAEFMCDISDIYEGCPPGYSDKCKRFDSCERCWLAWMRDEEENV